MKKPKSPSSQEFQESADNGQGHELDPVIDALLEHLPAPGDPFPDRKLWMQILDLVLKLVYPEEQPEQPESGQPT